MRNTAFVRCAGLALALGGALTLIVNAVLTPLVPAHEPFAKTASSWVFLWRQGASALAAVLLLLGSVGLHLRQAGRTGRFGALAFAVAFLGGGLLLAAEWADVFLVRTLALRAPEALRALEGDHGPGPYDVGAMAAVGIFAIGWIALAASTLRAGVLPRRAAWLVIAGLLSTPLLAAVLPGAWGAVVGNGVLGAGWLWLGHGLRRSAGG